MISEAAIARLAEQVPDLVNSVEGAATLALLQRQESLPPRSPFAFVVAASRRAAPRSAATGLHIQTVERQIDVVLYIEATDDPTGERSSAPMEALQDQVIEGLAGFQPAGAIGPLSLASVTPQGAAVGVAGSF